MLLHVLLESSASNVKHNQSRGEIDTRMSSESELSTCYPIENNNVKQSKRFICPHEDCWKAFNRKWKLERHICTHSNERPFKCDYPNCSKDYTMKQHLQRHILTSHKKTNLPPVFLSCPYPGCNARVQNKYSLKRHCKTHTVSKYECVECNASFKKKRLLTAHSFEHKGHLPHACSKCNESFPTKKHLIVHERKHRVYVCEYGECQEQFRAWSLLSKHLKLKHPRTYECDFCKRTYINKYTFTKHILLHLDKSNEKVFLCPNEGCIKYYKYEKNLKHHIQVAHEGKRFECTQENCTKVFKSMNRLKAHEIKHKNGELNAPRKCLSKGNRKPRFDKGLKKKSAAVLLSGVSLPPELEKRIAQNTVTPKVEQKIKYVLESARQETELTNDSRNNFEQDCISQETPKPIENTEGDPSKAILLFVSNKVKIQV